MASSHGRIGTPSTRRQMGQRTTVRHGTGTTRSIHTSSRLEDSSWLVFVRVFCLSQLYSPSTCWTQDDDYDTTPTQQRGMWELGRQGHGRRRHCVRHQSPTDLVPNTRPNMSVAFCERSRFISACQTCVIDPTDQIFVAPRPTTLTSNNTTTYFVVILPQQQTTTTNNIHHEGDAKCFGSVASFGPYSGCLDDQSFGIPSGPPRGGRSIALGRRQYRSRGRRSDGKLSTQVFGGRQTHFSLA